MQTIFRLAVFVVAILTLAWAAPLPASQLSLFATHTLTTSFTDEDGTPVAPNSPISGYIEAYTEGEAYYNPSELKAAAGYKDITVGTSQVATASFVPMTWLKTSTATIEYNGSTNFIPFHNLMGYGPQPPSPYDIGYIKQSAKSIFSLYFTAPAAGSYIARITDNYDLTYTLTQGSGSGYPFYETEAYSCIEGYLYTSSSNSSSSKTIFSDYQYNYLSPLADFTITKDGGLSRLTLVLDDVAAGETIFFGGLISSDLSGRTMVPIPASALLLGSGLLGMGLLRFRIKRRT